MTLASDRRASNGSLSCPPGKAHLLGKRSVKSSADSLSHLSYYPLTLAVPCHTLPQAHTASPFSPQSYPGRFFFVRAVGHSLPILVDLRGTMLSQDKLFPHSIVSMLLAANRRLSFPRAKVRRLRDWNVGDQLSHSCTSFLSYPTCQEGGCCHQPVPDHQPHPTFRFTVRQPNGSNP